MNTPVTSPPSPPAPDPNPSALSPPTVDHRLRTSGPAPLDPRSHQPAPPDTNCHQFADKTSPIQDLYRPVRFLLHRRQAGKIAQLPPPLREQINLMLQDGLPYGDIIARLGEAGKHRNKDNLSRWRKAEHQDWLAEQTWLAATGARPEPPPGVKDLALLIHEFDSDTLHAAMADHCSI